MRTESLSESGLVFRFLMRQYWKKILIWILGIVFASAGAGLAYADIYADPLDIMGYAITMENPAMHALVGTGYPVEEYHLGAVFANQLFLFSAIAMAILNISLILKSTRTDEEEGRLEIFLSLPISRSSLAIPPMWLAFGTNLLLTVMLGSVLSLIQLEDMPMAACFLYSAMLGATGMFFAGLALVSAQLAESSRGAAQLSYGVVLVSYLVRAVGDMQESNVVLLSPLGWLGQASLFVHNRLWPLAALLLGGILLSVIGFTLYRRRDMGAGLLAIGKGKKSASPFLRSPFALFWRMEQNSTLMWGAGLFLISFAFAAIIGDIEVYFSELEIFQAILPDDAQQSFTQQMISLVITIFSIFAAIPVMNVILRLRKEEESGRLEHLLSRPLSRSKIWLSVFLQATIAAVFLQSILAAGFLLGTTDTGSDVFLPGEIWLAAYAFVPALLFTAALTLFFVCIHPAFASLGWAYLLFSFLVTYLGGLLAFPDWLRKGSAFYAVPTIPVLENDWTGPLVFGALSILLVGMGLVIQRRRDIFFG